jgi:pyruvate, water dikinase
MNKSDISGNSITRKSFYWLDELNQAYSDLVGKKCANLGELTSLDLNVPPGFAVSVDAYEKYMQDTGLGEKIAGYFAGHTDLDKDLGKQMEAAKVVQEMFRSTPMPADMDEEISNYYRALCEKSDDENLAVAVRSSGAISMPGQMETYLNVSGGQDVVARIIAVWASSFNNRAIAFRLERELPIDKAPIGVAVLKMVDARSAGVVLTLVPTTGALDKVVVEGNWGLGESVVSGEVNPDSFTVDKDTLAIEKKLSTKTRCVVRTGEGTAMVDVPPEKQTLSCLNDDEVLEITRIAKQTESYFGVAQDMEWVVDEKLPFPENIIWVQARPAKSAATDEGEEIEYLLDQMARFFGT